MVEHEKVLVDVGIEPDPTLAPTVAPDPTASPDDGSIDAPATEEPVATRRNRWNIVLGLVVVALLVGAGGIAYRAHTVDRDASKTRADAAELQSQSDQLKQQSDQQYAQRAQIVAATATATDDLDRVAQALDDEVTAQNAYVDVLNHAADLHNSGHLQAAHDLIQGDGAAALADLQQKVAALDNFLADAQTAATHLQEDTHV